MENQENSRKTNLSDGEKPLKKARYLWEVKGKHHLRETNNNNNTIEENNEQTPCTSSKAPEDCCISSFLTKSEEIMDNEELDSSNEVPVSLVCNESNQDYYLRKWQARQIARGFVDNTINSVLENFNSPLFDPTDFVENYENLENVRDEGILMAIQFHGLQSGARNTEECITVPKKNDFDRDNLENSSKELEPVSTSSSDDSISSTSNFNVQIEDQMDFLNAAVSVAIEKKGLSYT